MPFAATNRDEINALKNWGAGKHPAAFLMHTQPLAIMLTAQTLGQEGERSAEADLANCSNTGEKPSRVKGL